MSPFKHVWVAAFAFALAVPAQGQLDKVHLKSGRPSNGGVMNSPSGNTVKRYRSEFVMQFQGESLGQTQARILAGSPMLFSHGPVTRVQPVTNVARGLALRLNKNDGKARVSIALPKVFQGGLVLVQGGGFQTLAKSGQKLAVDVPTILAATRALNTNQLKFTFFGYDKWRVVRFEVEISVSQNDAIVRF